LADEELRHHSEGDGDLGVSALFLFPLDSRL
jgi:hypothetical protein